MELIQNEKFDSERALYGREALRVTRCAFDGPLDGESAFKECRDISVSDCFFNLRYPFWHNRGLEIDRCEMTQLCRAALWYSEDISIENSKLHGIKALRECESVTMKGCDVISPEFGWYTRGISMTDCTASGEYFMMRSRGLQFKNVRQEGKYSFQYITNSVFESCCFDTKDAFWHARNVTVRDSVIKGEYLAWYSENVTFERCKIIGTQPFCYCKGLKLVDCEMLEADLCFEKSEVEATLTAPVLSIKNPKAGHILVPSVGELIFDDEGARGIVTAQGKEGSDFALAAKA